ncbi:carotenoid oxygenase [Scytonema sp. HK-05]|uniref:carotenoid oxygenase family protein n=1 Tax=Scytonema sp. HK-05 TaxID=1137095 RepID=UPI000936560E|nr:carotenoid oxygenase family protein [Scytonema sp. HK-05]OKH57532.1 hypothetical protein NIES2130_19135 [Scytonema sp. HK-05]BAY46764.1 carotenoid oxygenase [Scytonema sp. HK-05]
MVFSTQPTQAKAWAKAFAHPPTEFGPTPLRILSGAIPTGLRGTLYRNGPARFERGGQRMNHWIDGDGAVLAVHLRDQEATGVYRYVQTVGYQAEEKAGKLIFGGYGMTAPGDMWKRFGMELKNAANTSVIALPDKLLAMWEGGPPHALDLQTLNTFGLDTLGKLKASSAYSAHPKRDPETGEIYNYGITYGKEGVLNLFKSDRTGQILQQAAIALDGLPFFHDFVLAGRYLVFFIPPLRMNPLPFMAKQKSFSDSFSWVPNKGTQILVIDRATLEVVSRGEAQPWFQWHFSNGYLDASGTVVVDVVRYEDFRSHQYFREIPTGQTQTAAKGTLWQLRLNPQTGKITEMYEVLDRGCEFPTVASEQVGQASRFTYLLLYRSGANFKHDLWGTIGRFDHETGRLMEANLGENCYPVEPIYVRDASNPEQGWVLTVVFDGDRDKSEVWIFDAAHLDAEPICRLALPSTVPFGFHGTWKTEA